MSFSLRFLRGRFVLYLLLAGGLCFVLLGLGTFLYYSVRLPSHSDLLNHQTDTISRLYSRQGELLEDFAYQHRVYLPYESLPPLLVKAFISAEDKRFFSHGGIDIVSTIVAGLKNIGRKVRKERLIGASTITQQVAKNFLLSRERTLDRKIQEAILSLRIERILSKEKIFELYINEIYFGFGAWGIGKASLAYFDKSVSALTLEECAFLATLPKGPNLFNPLKHPARALERRRWVLEQMLKNEYITADIFKRAVSFPIEVTEQKRTARSASTAWFTEEVRRWALKTYGSKRLYKEGLVLYGTMDTQRQYEGQSVLQAGLRRYDRKRGYRGAIGHLSEEEWSALGWGSLRPPEGLLAGWRFARLSVVEERGGKLQFYGEEEEEGILWEENLDWMRTLDSEGTLGEPLTSLDEVLQVGDLVTVGVNVDGTWHIEQVPEVNGALVIMNAHTGEVLTLIGGWQFGLSHFNRATQAQRQPGSAFKPFVYATAFEQGYTSLSRLSNMPLVMEQGDFMLWRPRNYSGFFEGEKSLRQGLEQSHNLMAIRLGLAVGLDKIGQRVQDFQLNQNPSLTPSLAIGSVETTLLKLTAAYASFVNGGKKVTPVFISRVQNREGKTLLVNSPFEIEDKQLPWEKGGDQLPRVVDKREQILSPAVAYQVLSLLKGVVHRGTAARLNRIPLPLAGKTGTTNNSQDLWFIGLTPSLAIGLYMGYDLPTSLGEKIAASNTIIPIFQDLLNTIQETEELSTQSTFPIPKEILFIPVKKERRGGTGPRWEELDEKSFKEFTWPKPSSFLPPYH